MHQYYQSMLFNTHQSLLQSQGSLNELQKALQDQEHKVHKLEEELKQYKDKEQEMDMQHNLTREKENASLKSLLEKIKKDKDNVEAWLKRCKQTSMGYKERKC